MSIKKASIEDLATLVALDEEAFNNPYGEKNLAYELIENPVSNTLLYEVDDFALGYIIFRITFDSATIVRIGVKKSERKRGIATVLLKEAEKVMKIEGVEFLTLEVRKSNETAISFYKKNGFIYITTKRAYYDDGEDALYMMKGEV
jgi:ribosomal-protein-alanine N-acetyltransferase